jgi:alpha-beta hydrolase superfamily lysophospholipase
MDSIQPYQFQFTSTDGLRIACSRWDSCGTVRGIVQIAHGLGEHIGRYVGLIEQLVRAGLVVYGNDDRVRGRTAISPKNFGDFGRGGFNLLVEDMGRLTPSMGSFAAQQCVRDRSGFIDGLPLSGPGALADS